MSIYLHFVHFIMPICTHTLSPKVLVTTIKVPIWRRYLSALGSLQAMGLGAAQTCPDHPHIDVEMVESRLIQAMQSHREETNLLACCTSQTLRMFTKAHI